MMSVTLLEKHFQTRRFTAIVEGVIANGLSVPLPLQVRLSLSPVAGVALGLRRLVQLTYGPTSLSRRMTDWLLEHQQPDGRFADPTPKARPCPALGAAAGSAAIETAVDPLPTAAAVAALHRLIIEHGGDRDEALVPAHERGMAALAGMQQADALFGSGDDPHTDQRAATSAFILLLLGHDELFRRTCRYAELMNWFEDHADELDSATRELWQIARVDVPQLTPPSPALIAIAA